MNTRLKSYADYYVGGAIHVVLKPVVILLQQLMKRNHSLKNIKEITVLKMLGGGSLVIAYPSLLALKQSRSDFKLNLLTTPSIRPFAEVLGIFDEIIVIRDGNPFELAADSVRAILRLFCARAIIDLEIHSRLSSVFILLTCAVNRIGIYTDISFWRKSLYTHLLFYNKDCSIYLLYDQISILLGADSIDFQLAKKEFQRRIVNSKKTPAGSEKIKIGVAPGCSDLSKERMLNPGQWITLLQGQSWINQEIALCFFGGKKDETIADEIITRLQPLFPGMKCHNCCGGHSLQESIELISEMETLYCIDSCLIHFGRLLGVRTVSFWGPTDPQILLRPDPQSPEETHYVKLSCSPCVHTTFDPPCYGNNVCMQASLLGKNYTGTKNPVWLAKP